jgi:hypothetical protein
MWSNGFSLITELQPHRSPVQLALAALLASAGLVVSHAVPMPWPARAGVFGVVIGLLAHRAWRDFGHPGDEVARVIFSGADGWRIAAAGAGAEAARLERAWVALGGALAGLAFRTAAGRRRTLVMRRCDADAASWRRLLVRVRLTAAHRD